MLHRFSTSWARLDRQSIGALRHGLLRIQEAGIAFASIADVLDRLGRGEPIRSPTAVFTVDDGYADFIELAAPIFRELRCPVTVFLTTDVIGGRLWYWWDEVEWLLMSAEPRTYRCALIGRELPLDLRTPVTRRNAVAFLTSILKAVPDAVRRLFLSELSEALGVAPPSRPPSQYRTVDWSDVRSIEGDFIRFGPHSRTHPILSRLDDETARDEIVSSWQAVRQECRLPEPVFCYPNGTTDSFGPREEKIVEEAGLTGAVMYDRARLQATPDAALRHRFHVPRIEFPIDPDLSVVLAAGAYGLRPAASPAPQHASPALVVAAQVPADETTLKVEVCNFVTGRHHYGVLRGLIELADREEICLSFRPRRDWPFRGVPNALVVTFRAGSEPPVIVCYDMMDWPELAVPEALEPCDVYVKRSVAPDGYPGLSAALAHKIVPWGFSLPATVEFSSHATALYLRRYLDAEGRDEHRVRRRELAKNLAFRALRRVHSGYAIEPYAFPVPDYRVLAETPRVFLQTRLWDPVTTASRHYRSTEQLNRFRVELVRALRQALGDRFVGGVIPSPLAQTMCPELVTDLGSDFASYFRTMGSCLIAVTEAGIHGSNGARLPELLGAGRCVVSERLVYPPLRAPRDGQEILYFSDVAECVERCLELIAAPERAVAIAKLGHDFYLAETAPAAMARRFLEAAGLRVATPP